MIERLPVEWIEPAIPALPETAKTNPQLLHRCIAPPNRFRCPECNSVIYSRRNRLCGNCGQELPAQFLFNREESARVARLLDCERKRHKSWLARQMEK